MHLGLRLILTIKYKFLRHFAVKQSIKLIEESSLFDSDWYRNFYANDLSSIQNPIEHYVRYGAFKGYFPNPLFDSDYYLQSNPDVKNIGINPLIHFIKKGVFENKDPHPLFSLIHYSSVNTNLTQSGLNPLRHYLLFGAEESFDPHPLFLSSYYLSQKDELRKAKINPLIDYLFQEKNTLRSAHPLFDEKYYLEQNADVLASKMNPLIHFIKFGWKESRNPMPLFEIGYYRTKYSSLLGENENPLINFWLNGTTLKLNPNPYFDTAGYLNQYQDIAAAQLNPLVHYITYGYKEGRLPSNLFEPKFYSEKYPDVKSSGMEPLAHYLTYGIKEGRKISAISSFKIPENKELWQDLLPSKNKEVPLTETNKNVSIVIPIYRDVSTTKACVESVLNSKSKTAYKLLLINDCSPEEEMFSYLSSLTGDSRVEVHTNKTNLGFVGTVNKGMSLYPASDVILLNSDTLVSDFWIDRLIAHAARKENIGTITPFSNNATICNYPDIDGFQEFPEGESLASYNQAFYQANLGRSVEIPTAVGFCMFISRACLKQLGLFDQETFGRGYGEENDFCLRASKMGWKHLLAADTFVYHKGEVSFAKESSPSKLAATKILRELYPDYDSLIIRHLERDPAFAFRLAATAARYRQQKKPVVLIITHALGGGTEKHIQQLRTMLQDKAAFLVLRPALMPKDSGDFVLEFENQEKKIQFIVNSNNSENFAFEFLKTFGISKIHVHHTIGIPFNIVNLAKRLDVSFDFTIHDYFTICPQITLTNEKGDYCEEPAAAACNLCIAKRPTWGAVDITSWREKNRELVLKAEHVICPSNDVRLRMQKYIPDVKYFVVPHLVPKNTNIAFKIPKLGKNDPLRVAIIAALWPHKGSNLVLETAKMIKERNQNIELNLIGYFNKDQADQASQLLNITGEFCDEDLKKLIEQNNPHLIWFPARCPETFSFTLSEAIESGRPILCSALGALTERLENRDWTWMHRWNIEAEEVIEYFLKIAAELVKDKTGTKSLAQEFRGSKLEPENSGEFYHEKYFFKKICNL